MTKQEEDDLLIEAASSAYRPYDRMSGTLLPHPAWRDLDQAGRARAFEVTVELRSLEAALDANGLSTTSQAVLNRILRGSNSR
jgi:hypothetical protein